MGGARPYGAEPDAMKAPELPLPRAAAWWLAVAVPAVLLGMQWEFLPGQFIPGIGLNTTFCFPDGSCETYLQYTPSYFTADAHVHGAQMNLRVFLVAAALCCALGALAGARRSRRVVIAAGLTTALALVFTVSQRSGAYALVLGLALWGIWPDIAATRPWSRAGLARQASAAG
jgi:hypothetical protein